jgi:cold shock CspA family protein
MGKSQETFNKKEKEKKRLKKRQDKQAKREERKAAPKNSGFENMIAYVDEYGNITDTPPDLTKKKVIKLEDIEIGVPKREKEDEEEVDPIRSGKVEFFNSEKGFGFIKENDTNEKYFVHVSSLTGEVVENDKVSFELEQGLKGLNAVRVKKI